MAKDRFTKDPDAVLDYTYNWSDWLGVGESIVTADVTVPAGLTKDSQTNDANSVTVWLSGGTADEVVVVTCRITTDSVPARTDDRSITITVRER